MLPLILVIAVAAMSWTHPRTDSQSRYTRVLMTVTILGAAAAIVLTMSFDIHGIFFGALIIVPLTLAIAVSTGRMPPVWMRSLACFHH